MKLTVHRATNQIGGNCIELALETGERLILDAGRPLDAPKTQTGLLPASLALDAPVEGVLISHPHQDHYGLIDELPGHWPIYSGKAAGGLMKLTAEIFGKAPERDYRHWESGRRINVGPFAITPYLTDHSAFDAYMLLIEAMSKRVLYSGDFRNHGRKAALVRRMMESPPPDIDVLLMEGTNLGSDKPTKSEADLEADFIALFNETAGRVFVCWSAQNVDRTVTLYRACLQSGRTLVVDLYTAEVLELLADAGRLPRAGWGNFKVVITPAFASLYRKKGRGDFVARMAVHGIAASALSENERTWTVMIRPSLIRDFARNGVVPTANDAWSFSQWRGYLKEDDGRALQTWFEEGGARAKHIHTSGHASVADLKTFAAAINPKSLVPIHGVAWDSDCDGFANITRLQDGEPMSL